MMKIRTLITAVAVACSASMLSPIALSADADTGSKKAKANYPTSIESMIERRREALRKRREARQDWISGRRWRQTPWENAQEEWMDRRADIMDERFRRRRDAHDAWRKNWGRWNNPWSQWYQDVTDARRDARELDRLARDEYFEKRHYSSPYYGWGYWPY
jgi:hypothetical protein